MSLQAASSKSRKYRSKKLRRCEVYLSSSDSDDSESMSTSLSSSSDDSCIRRRARSGTRKHTQGRTKKAQRRSDSRDSSEGSLRVRKRKRSKRKNDDEVREKPHRKKKLRKEVSVSSMSGRSWRCSTCHGGDSGSDDSDFDHRRGRSERKEESNRRLERGGSEKRGRYKARSCSSCNCSSESCDERIKEKYIRKNNSRRLRSVITVMEGAEGSRELFGNESKEETLDDHDYPCRSNDSNDGGGKRELDHLSLPSSEDKVSVDDEKGDEYTGFSKTSHQNSFTDLKIRDKSCDETSQYDPSNVYVAGTSESMEKKTSGVSEDSQDVDDLESILRHRALENLRRFRGEIKSTAKASDQKNKIGSDLKQLPFNEKHEPVQGNFLVNNAAVRVNVDNNIERTNLPMGRRDSIPHPINNKKSINGDKGNPGSAKHHSPCSPEKVVDVGNPSEPVMASNSYRTNNSEAHHHLLKGHPSQKQTPISDVKNSGLRSAAPKQSSCTLLALRNNNLNKGQDEIKQKPASHKPPHSKSVMIEGDVGKDAGAAKTAQAAIHIVDNNARNLDKFCDPTTPKHCEESVKVGNSSNKLQDEANQGSQFEQKTMKVMRGGEVIQVSYKVYIPKRAPALVRRQLQR